MSTEKKSNRVLIFFFIIHIHIYSKVFFYVRSCNKLLNVSWKQMKPRFFKSLCLLYVRCCINYFPYWLNVKCLRRLEDTTIVLVCTSDHLTLCRKFLFKFSYAYNGLIGIIICFCNWYFIRFFLLQNQTKIFFLFIVIEILHHTSQYQVKINQINLFSFNIFIVKVFME